MTIKRWPSNLPGRSWLKRQVESFHLALNAMLRRLREDLSRTVAQAVSVAVGEAVRHLAGKGARTSVSHAPSDIATERRWSDRPDTWGDHEPEDYWDDDDARDFRQPVEKPIPTTPEPEMPVVTGWPWPKAVATGLRAAAWWVTRSTRHPLLRSSIVAVVAAVSTVILGPALVTGAAGLCLGLFGLIDGLAHATAALHV
jgi:hypothetical protein